MPTLVLPQDIEDLGFEAAQFNQDDADFQTWLQKAIDECEAEVIIAAGGADAFAALLAGPAQNTALLAKGEKYLVQAELWSRRVITLDNMAVNARGPEFAAVQKQYTANATSADKNAWEYIGQVTGDQESGTVLKSGSIEEGPYRHIS